MINKQVKQSEDYNSALELIKQHEPHVTMFRKNDEVSPDNTVKFSLSEKGDIADILFPVANVHLCFNVKRIDVIREILDLLQHGDADSLPQGWEKL